MEQLAVNEIAMREYMRKELPSIIEEEPAVRRVIVNVFQNQFADKDQSDDRFERLFQELKKDREENNKKWEENNKISEERWKENNKKWEENNKKLDELIRKSDERFAALIEEIKVVRSRQDTFAGAIGARWGIAAESSFRSALKAILENRFDIQVLNVTEYDKQGFVFGHPDQVEFDIIIKNGEIIVCEIKSSMSRSDMYTFHRKVQFYENEHHCKVTGMMVISPMVDKRAMEVAKHFGIEVYTYAEEVKL